MNAYQRRQYRRHVRSVPIPDGCFRQGYSGTTSYPDLMCTDGYMSDMDADGHDPTTARQPCEHCNPAEHAEWMRDQDDEDDELPDGLYRDPDGTLTYTCRHCESERQWYGLAEEFDRYDHMNCGGSPYCLP